jgi:2-isopropylmalate synthase
MEAKKIDLKNAKLVAFGSTKRKDNTCEQDTNLQSLLSAETDVVCIFGKSRDFQVTEILHTTLEDNLQMIKETIQYLVNKGKEVIFDAEHFFTGYEENPEYTFQCINAAVE